ncbi:hypothetical protein [Nonlabens antarcticus]|uniref:hypothetical protein n=1 Tax=Nonlabens antarcticus TaxID=392714 RepID=UPI001891E68F|nr:hypothetical protein [Nonlabens antarcticus]
MLALVSVGITSCDIGDDNDYAQIQYQLAEVTSVEMPENLKFGKVNEIVVRYDNPTNCNIFAGFDVQSRLNERDVTVVTTVRETGDCDELNIPTEKTLKFVAVSNGTYTFRFLSGRDADGEPEYLEFTVEVVE